MNNVDQDVVSYIREAQSHGLSQTQIKQHLLDVGWEAEIIENAFSHAKAWGPVQLLTNKNIYAKSQSKEAYSIQKSETADHLGKKNTPGPRFKKKILIPMSAILVIGLVALGYLFVYASPSRVWNSFVSNQKLGTSHGAVYLTYEDRLLNPDQLTGLKDFTLTTNGNYYSDFLEAENIQVSGEFLYTVANYGLATEQEFKYVLSNNILYLYFGTINPFDSLISAKESGSPNPWIKIDLKRLEALIANDAVTGGTLSSISEAWRNTRFITVKKFIGREMLNGNPTLHFQNEVDKGALKKFAEGLSDNLLSLTTASDDPKVQGNIISAKVNLAIEGLRVESFDTWIGLFDRKLHKINFTSNAPSIVQSAFEPLALTKVTNKDTQRIIDMKNLSKALELYFNDNGGYPESSSGTPIGISPTSYLSFVPTAPVPADGGCSFYNTYWYTPLGTKKVIEGKTAYSSYQYTFCLATAIGDYQPGIAKATPEGLITNIPCPTSGERCGSVAEPLKNSGDPLPAKISLQSEVKDFGVKQTVQIPPDSFDLVEALSYIFQSGKAKFRDTKRLSDIKLFLAAINLYKADKGSYPKNIQDLSPTYLTVLPQAPTPPDGPCSNDKNTYSYALTAKNQYQLSFCLGGVTEGYQPGFRTLTANGIE